MNERTLTAVFDDRSEAMTAIEQLVAANVPRSSIRLLPETESDDSSICSSRENTGFWSSLSNMFMPEEDRYSYNEALDRGSTMVVVEAIEENMSVVESILEEHGSINMDEREESWRSEGWSGYGGSGEASTIASSGTQIDDSDEDAIPIVEEQVKVGKRAVSGGCVKVRSYVVETPVEENVNLRDETVDVETREVDRKLTPEEAIRLFQDRTIEAEEMDEEAIVSKTARVTGEVVVKNGTRDRVETVKETARTTKVDMDDERKQKTSGARRRAL